MTKEVDVRLVFEYVEPDPSVGINGGFVFAGISISKNSFAEAEDSTVVSDEGLKAKYVFDAQPFDSIAEDLSQSLYDRDDT